MARKSPFMAENSSTSGSIPSSLFSDRTVNWSIVVNMSMSFVRRRQKRSNLPKICISLKENLSVRSVSRGRLGMS